MRFKKFVIFLLSLILLANVNINASARNYMYDYNKNEVTITYSQFTVPQTAYITGGVLGIAFSLGHFAFDNTVMTGALGVEYYRTLNHVVKVGGIFCGEYMTSDTYQTIDGEKQYNGTYDFGYCSLMAAVKLTWFDYYHFRMYSKLAVGPAAGIGDTVGISIGAQVSPICLEFGSTNLRGFAEFGIGMQGVASIGIKHMF